MSTEAEKEAPPQWSRWPTAEPTLSFEVKPLPAALTQAPPISEPERPTRWLWIALGIAAVCALGAGGGYYLLTQPEPSPLVAQPTRPPKPAAPIAATAPVPAATPAPAAAASSGPPAADASGPQLAVGIRPIGDPHTASVAAPPAPSSTSAPAAPAATETTTYAVGLRPVGEQSAGRPRAPAPETPASVAMPPPAETAVAPRPAPRRKPVARETPQQDQPSRTVNSIRF